MKIILLIVFSFIYSEAFITAIRTDYGDSIRVVEYHKNGKIKTKGLKIKKFRHGKWYYYDNKGFIIKIEEYKNGKRTKSLNLGALDEKESSYAK